MYLRICGSFSLQNIESASRKSENLSSTKIFRSQIRKLVHLLKVYLSINCRFAICGT